jgi:hypothetical protein
MRSSCNGFPPNRFALVKPVNPGEPAVVDVIADWKKTPGTVGIRVIFTNRRTARRRTPASNESCASP